MHDDLVAAIDDALAGVGGRNVAPWHGWLAVALVAFVDRQRWHHEVAAQLADLEGELPEHAGWSYAVDGLSTCLTGPDGELLDIDMRDGGGDTVAPSALGGWIQSTRERWLARRLWRWRPSRELVSDGARELIGSLVTAPDPYRVQLVPELVARLPAIIADLARPDAEARWAAALGDRDDDAQRRDHARWLIARVAVSESPSRILRGAVAILPQREAFALCRAQLAIPDAAAGAAIEIMCDHPEWPSCDDVVALLRRISGTDDLPYPAATSCRYVLERKLVPELARARFVELSSIAVAKGFRGNPFESDYAVLALRFLPDLALPLVRRALRSTTPMCVQDTAALLAVLDRTWCHRELVAALDGPAATRPYVVAALAASSSELARRRAAAHDIAPPHDATRGGYTFAEVVHANAATFMTDAIERARIIARSIPALPDEWTG